MQMCRSCTMQRNLSSLVSGIDRGFDGYVVTSATVFWGTLRDGLPSQVTFASPKSILVPGI
jgi:hypothetical protein